MLQLNGVSKRYDERTVVDSVDLHVEAGRTTVLIGPSGCGKSTLLRLMIGLIRPDAGEVLFQDKQVGDGNLASLRQRMGYVIQSGGLFPHLTARRNIALAAEQLGRSRDDNNERIRELAALTHIPQDALDRYPVQLSGGQRQRISLMRALMLDPDVLLLDEPLGALDPMIRADLQTELRVIFRTLNKTVVVVTHDMREAAHFSHHIVLMREGSIVQQGAADELTHEPADPFVTRFIRAQVDNLEEIDAASEIGDVKPERTAVLREESA